MSDRTTLSTAEVDAMLTATATSRVIKKKDNVAFLGNVKTPTLNMFRGRSSARSTPTRGAYKCHFSPPRGKRLQPTSGRDIHNFESADTLFDVEYSVGRVHLGDEWVHQQIQEAGIDINHAEIANSHMIDTSKRGWWTKGKDAGDILVNLADQKLTSFELNYTQELNKEMWRAHTAEPKFWQGADTIFSVASNTTGPVGNRDRATNQYLRHKLKAVANRKDWEFDLDKLRRDANRKIHDGSKTDYIACGQNVYDAIKDQMFTGSNAVTTPRFERNLDAAQGAAREMAKAFNIGLPDDAIYLTGVGIITIEPVFEELDLEDAPSIPWEDRLYGFNLAHAGFRPTKGRDGAKKVHQTPYNQEVTRISCYGEYAMYADWLDCHFVAYANY